MHKYDFIKKILTFALFLITIFLYFYLIPSLVSAEPNEGLGSKIDITEDAKDIHGNNLRDRMTRRSLNGSTGNIGFDDLAYLKIPYYGFDNVAHDGSGVNKGNIGEMVVNKKLADEVLLIFQDLYKIKYPIEKMTLIDEYYTAAGFDGKQADFLSIEENNTSAFSERTTDNNTASYHALGQAIDINPIINPYIFFSNSKGYYSSHDESAPYINNRLSMTGWSDIDKRACINSNSEIYKIFSSRGWIWLGITKESREYGDTQHFEKRDLSNAQEIDTGTHNADYKKESAAQLVGELFREWWDGLLKELENFFTGRNEQSVLISYKSTEADVSSNSIVQYAIQWVDVVHYELRMLRRACSWFGIRLFMVCLSCNET